MVLNKDLDEVCGRILGTKPMPNVREAFLKVHLEESRQKVMMGSSSSSSIGEGSTLVVHGSQQPLNNNNKPRKGQPWCNHYRRPSHTKDTCWKIHGKPTDWRLARLSNDKESRKHLASTNDNTSLEPNLSNKEQMELLHKMFAQSQSNNMIGTGSFAQIGNLISALNVKQVKQGLWIVDSGASNHMMGDVSILRNYKPSMRDLLLELQMVLYLKLLELDLFASKTN